MKTKSFRPNVSHTPTVTVTAQYSLAHWLAERLNFTLNLFSSAVRTAAMCRLLEEKRSQTLPATSNDKPGDKRPGE